jgi:hypothetical protein
MSADPFEYDVAISFASEDRAVAEEVVDLLVHKNIKVFRDEYRSADAGLWGKDMVDHLVNLYARKSRYCVMLISQNYPLKSWTKAERTSAHERALRDPEEYILPVQLDDREVPGVRQAKGFRDLRQHSIESIVTFLEERLRHTKVRSGPPSASHDLRSGNVPSENSQS